MDESNRAFAKMHTGTKYITRNHDDSENLPEVSSTSTLLA